MIVHEIEQRSAEWYALRAGMPTASEFSKIVTSKGEPSKSASTYAMTLAAEMFAGKPMETWEGNSWTERGREMETEAISLYEFTRDETVVPVGFVTDDNRTMGASPDGFIGEDGLVEIKCLKAENHVKAILYNRKHKKMPPDYVQQAQGQMLICERKWCDVVFFHPELPLLIIRQAPDGEFWKNLTENITQLLKDRDEVLGVLEEAK